MLPPLRARIEGSTACAVTNRLRTFTCIDSSHWSSVLSTNGARVDAIALLTRTSTPPNSAIAASTSARRSSALPMSHRTGNARPPASRIASAVACAVPGRPVCEVVPLRAAQTTAAPASARPDRERPADAARRPGDDGDGAREGLLAQVSLVVGHRLETAARELAHRRHRVGVAEQRRRRCSRSDGRCRRRPTTTPRARCRSGR